MIVIVDYGVGNLGSVRNMLKKANFDAIPASEKSIIEEASKIILPGIGSFDYCMQKFNASGLRAFVTKKVMNDKIPLLGICVGLQMLMESSEEGVEPGLGWIGGRTVKFEKERVGELKIPHMGWTDVTFSKPSLLTKGLVNQPRFYFVHSYYVEPKNQEDVLLSANYGYDFTAAVSHDNIYGVQFHPEKSHRYGMKLLENFARL